MTNKRGTLYTGMTNDLQRRVYEHRTGTTDGFTSRYKMTRLIYFEETNDVHVALNREREIKGWLRKKKIELIKSLNPAFTDLSEGWFE